MTIADLSLQLNLIKANYKAAMTALNTMAIHIANVEAEIAKLEKPEPEISILQLATKALVPVTEARTVVPEPPKVETRLCPTCNHDCFPMVVPIDPLAKTSWRVWFCGHCKTVKVDPRKLLRDGTYLPNLEQRKEIQFTYAEWDKLKDWQQPKEIARRFAAVPESNITKAADAILGKIKELEKLKVEAVPEVKEDLIINDEWQRVLDLLENGSGHVFVTGDAGTGKSTLLHYFVSRCRKNVAVIAPTGVAAIRAGGQTLHSFFRFGAHAYEDDDVQRVSDDEKRKKYERLDILIIDEISMVRADMMDAVERHLRLNGPQPGRPFGGVRIIMFGDLYQLPPVSREKGEKKYLESRYGTAEPFFFHAECFRDTPPKIVELTTIFRQKDPTFTAALNAIRKGNILPEHLDLLNSRVTKGFVPPATDEPWLTITTTNDAAKQANVKMLAAIPTEARWFDAILTGQFNVSEAPTDDHLELKVGASVIFVRNNPQKGWVNGTMGKVTSLKPLKVAFKGREEEVEPEIWEKIVYEYDEKKRKLTRNVAGTFSQIPLKHAAAMTIHRVQGLTLERVVIDLNRGAFASGQTYVAVSRATKLDGMVLLQPVKDSDLITSSEVRKFMTGQPIARPNSINGQMTLAV